MKHMVATCTHLLAAVQWRLVDAHAGAQREARAACGARRGRGARHEARGACNTRRVRCDRARREVFLESARGL
jgi:hypothetical protein